MSISLRINKSSRFTIPRKSRHLLFVCIAVFIFIFFSSGIKAKILEYSDIYALEAKTENSEEIKTDEKIKIIFNQPVIFTGDEQIYADPAAKIRKSLTQDNKILELSFTEPLLSETKYEIAVENVRAISGTVMSRKTFIFYTDKKGAGVESGTLPNARERKFADFETARERYVAPEVSRPKSDYEVEPQITTGKYIDVSISSQIMTIFEDGIEVNRFLVSSGIQGLSTPLGNYSIQRKEPNHWSGYGLWMPYSMNFSGPYYIHELPYWPSGFREGENHLGHQASHGCVRLGIGPAKYVYEWAEIGTPLVIHK